MLGRVFDPKGFLSATIIGGLLVFNVGYSHAETAIATASDHQAGEIAVIKQAIEQQRAEEQAHDQATAVAQPSASARSVPTAVTGEEVATPLPELNTPVIDPAQLLSVQEKAQLEQKILQMRQEAKAQIGIVMVPTTGQQDIFSYSLKIAEDWGLGSEKYDNGLLIVVAKNDRKIQILTGYGLEGVLPDIVVNRVIREQITPYFKMEQYGQGLIQGLNEIEKTLNLDPDIARQAADQLREQQEKYRQEAQARENSFSRALIILLIAVFASAIVGKRLAGIGAGVAGVISGLIAGSGLVMSLIMGFVLFALIASSIAQGVTRAVVSSGGGGGRRGGGGFGGGGGFRGGGGGFGGGGASGSW